MIEIEDEKEVTIIEKDLIGPKGEDGKSAYELACENGFSGTLDEWLESLKGQDGLPGENGVDGLNGQDGIDGKDGYTPQKGIDYFTNEEKQEMIDSVLSSLINAEEVSY